MYSFVKRSFRKAIFLRDMPQKKILQSGKMFDTIKNVQKRRAICVRNGAWGTMNSTAYAKRTQYKPIDFLFRGVVDAKAKTKKVVFVDAFQILNDRYVGRMNVCNYFAVAENSVRLNELNIIALEELKNYHLVMKENYNIPDGTVYGLPISPRFLESDEDFKVLLSTLKDNGYKKGSIVLTFYGNTLERVDGDGKKRYNRLRRAGYKTAIAQFGEDFNSADILAAIGFDYLRCDAKYFDSSQSKKRLLAMLLKFCNSSKISLIMDGVDMPAQYARFKREGVKLVSGNAVSKLSQWVTNEFLGLPEPEGDRKKAYLLKLKKELDAKQRAELAELNALRSAATERAKARNESGVMPISARPELAKSPFWIRLEEQRNAVKLAAEALLAEKKKGESGDAEGEEADAAQAQSDVKIQRAQSPSLLIKTSSDIENANSKKGGEAGKDKKEDESVSPEDSGVIAPARPKAPYVPKTSKLKKKKKSVRVDIEKHNKLLEEFLTDGMFGNLGGMTKKGGIGVTMRVESEDKDIPSLVGSYNDKGQWVDEDGNVFDGYFDIDGKWVEYERFDSAQEGSYNDFGQWTDKDGVTYDGYFDESGRWIDYTFTAQDGEVVDNGYFDDKLSKWVPFGFFAEDGSYHKL